MNLTGIVVIGRNEANRLRSCLRSVQSTGLPCVYVDSGSRDGSPEIAEQMKVPVIRMDSQTPYTAARGRNEGMHHLLARHVQLKYLQFVDGDCELDPSWIQRAVAELDREHDAAIVCGRLREANPHSSVYNLLCDLEWNRPAGETPACGGIFMTRIKALQDTGGFNSALSAGEEPELCRRLRNKKWKILRLAVPMAVHDAEMHHFGQWWNRAVRSGCVAMETVLRNAATSEPRDLRRVGSIAFWSIVLPLCTVLSMSFSSWGALLLLAYPIQWFRMYRRRRREISLSRRESRIAASFNFLSKIAEFVGMIQAILQWSTSQRRMTMTAHSSNNAS